MCAHFILWVMSDCHLGQSICYLRFSSVAQSCPTLCNPMDCSMGGLPVRHQLLEFAQTHVHWVGDAIQPSHPLSSPSLPTFHLSQHQGLFKWDSSSHQVAKVLEFQLQHQSFQWIFRIPLGWTGWISLLSKGLYLSGINITVLKVLRRFSRCLSLQINVASCDGKCPSATIYNINIESHLRFCKCCRENGVRNLTVPLYCSGNGTEVLHTLQEPMDCTCQWN